MRQIKTSVFTALLLLASVPILLSSCLERDEVETSDYCYISGFKLGRMKRALHTLSSQGKDSTYYVVFDSDAFPLSINQRTQVIENLDSLPYGTLTGSVVTTVTYTGAVLQHRAADAPEEAEWSGYKNTDSVDFSKPRQYVVLSSDGTGVRFYTVKLNVHQQQGDVTKWSQRAAAEGLSQCTAMRTAKLQDHLMVYGQTSMGTLVRQFDTQANAWTSVAHSFPANAVVETLCRNSEALYVSTRDGQIYRSQDGCSWQMMGSAVVGQRLVAVTDHLLYALQDGHLMSTVDAETWVVEQLDDEESYLPREGVRSICYQRDNGNHRLVLVGYRPGMGDKCAQVWAKSWYATTGRTQEADAQWMYYPVTSENYYHLPVLGQLHTFYYDNKLMAMGTKLDRIYMSQDHGITWKGSDEVTIPQELDGAQSVMAVTVDADNYIWIVTASQVWRGRLQRMGFDRQDR